MNIANNWEVSQTVANAHKDGIWSVSWKRDALITGGLDGIVKGWHGDPPKEQRSYEGHQLGVISVDSDRKGSLIASSGLDMHIRVSQSDGKLIKDIDTGPMETWTICFNPDGTLIASGSQAGNVNIWGVESGTKEQSLTASGKFVMSVAISPDGNLVACGASDGVVQVFDLVQARRLHSLGGHAMAVRSLSFSKDSTTLLTASDDMHVHMYDVRAAPGGGSTAESTSSSKANLIASFSGHSSWVLSVAQNPITKVFASASSDRKVKIWDLGTRQCIHTFNEHTDQVWGVAWNDDGSKLVSCSDDKSLIVYKSQ